MWFLKWFKKDKSQQRLVAEIFANNIMRTDDERQVAQSQRLPSTKSV